jgi:tetratricopeptide (TPR) repeat protein
LNRAAILTSNQTDEIEPDGQPNARNIPRSTLKSNIAYHLALTHYLKGDFATSAEAWSRRLDLFRDNDDQIVSASYWLYLSRKRSGDHPGAAAALRDIRLDMDIIENHSYHRLLLCFKGDLKPEEVGQTGNPAGDTGIAYGLAVRKLLIGDTAAARADFDRIIATDNWPAFGYIAAEADRARMKGR